MKYVNPNTQRLAPPTAARSSVSVWIVFVSRLQSAAELSRALSHAAAAFRLLWPGDTQTIGQRTPLGFRDFTPTTSDPETEERCPPNIT